ncbi:hypothetical protein IL252_16510 [Halomicrobium sp. IBSBa]|uniref:DUF7093 family protein n=1 Tax=Halomicrobium sp. IBSBa TaxID=2778916 RepID=UPI001ABFC9AB|nr:hypothetical protein [Halomicrobium sp. IBSBa]MBO4249413.1 hypothetical protein [Halomicrobium sp. IBSBa]
MGLKCSVIGHAYGETTVERDREEQGSEVVITIREVETCERCGTERVVSENKEVTAIETPDDVETTEETAASETEATTPDTESESESDAAEASEPSDEEPDDTEDVPAAGEELSASEIVGGEETPSTPDADPDTGAEIIDAESDEPVSEEEAVDEELADPTVDPEIDEQDGDEQLGSGSSAVDTEEIDADDPDADDAMIIDEDDDDPVEQGGRQPGEWPEEPDTGDNEWQPDTIGTIDEDDEEQATETTTLTVPDGQFRCPECDFTTLVESSSLRRGDFCPECHRGTLVHEPEDETRKE